MNALRRGFVAGLAGGAAGSAAKLLGELVFPPRLPGQVPPPAVMVEKVTGRSLNEKEQMASSQVIHWTFGILLGGIYGLAAETYPVVTAGRGVAFGLALFLGTHESALPLLGLNKPPWDQPAKEHASEFVTHSLYGFATESVRRWIRERQS